MLSIKEGLHFDAAQAVNEIEQFVRSEVHRLGKRGVVLGLSGGLDSTTFAYLCVRALGRAHVLTYMLPERDTDAQNMADAELVAQTLGLKATHIDISPMLATLVIQTGFRRTSQQSSPQNLKGRDVLVLQDASGGVSTYQNHQLLT